MSRASLVMLGMFVGSIIGGYIPVIFGASLLSFSSIIGNTAGGIFGVWVAFNLTQDL